MINHKAVVTGAPGWLGTAFVNAMISGLQDSPQLNIPRYSKISVLSHPNSLPMENNISDQVEIVRGSLGDKSKLETLLQDSDGATVFHMAGVIHPRYVSQLYDVNVEGTRNLLEQAIKANVRRFIYVSSNSPIGCNASSGETFTEQSPYNPYMNYGRSKMQAERLVNEAYMRGSIETVIIRPPWFYGPHQPDRQTLFFRMIKEGRVPLVGDGCNRRSMAYVDNICQGLLLAEQTSKANGQTYWIADAEPYTMNQIISTIEAVLINDFGISVKPNRVRLPNIVSQVAFGLDLTLQYTGIYHQKLHVLSELNKTIACSITKAAAELGYLPAVALHEGIRRSVDWVHAHGGTI